MSVDAVPITLSLPPGAVAASDFLARTRSALTPVLRLPGALDAPPPREPELAAGEVMPGAPGLTRFDREPRGDLWPEVHHLPLLRPVALRCSPLEDEGPPVWHGHLAWDDAVLGQMLLPLARLQLIHDADGAEAGVILPLQGYPLTDMAISFAGPAPMVVPAPGRAVASGDRRRLVDALAAVDASFSDVRGRVWAIQLTARTAPADAAFLRSLEDWLNGGAKEASTAGPER